MAQEQVRNEEIQSNKSIFANLKPLETLLEEEGEYFDNRVFTPFNNDPKMEMISIPGTPKELIQTPDLVFQHSIEQSPEQNRFEKMQDDQLKKLNEIYENILHSIEMTQ